MRLERSNVVNMDILTAIKERCSVRAFLDKPVSDDILKNILDTARWSPSGVNHQPWKVMTLQSTIACEQHLREQIRERIITARNNELPENPDYHYYPHTWVDPYKTRRKACGQALYSALNITINDTEKRKEQWYKNYDFFHAPVGLIFYLDAYLEKGSWMDMGMFIQSVMLAAKHYGLDTCAQASLAEYPDIIRETLAISNQYHIVCGMALGYADWSAPINQYRTTREDIDSITCS